MSKKAQNVQEGSRCNGIQGGTSKEEIKSVFLNARSIIIKKNELNIMVDDTKPHIIYTIICLKSVCRSTFADCRSQFLLDRLGRCLKLIVSYRGTSSHEFESQFGLEFFYTRKNSQTTVGPITNRPRHRPSERRNNLKGILYLHARWRLTSRFTQMVTDDFVGAPKPPQSKRKLSALQRSSQARQRMRRCGSSLTGNLHMRIT